MVSIYAEHADIYDLAFDWDVAEDAAWMHARLGDECRSVLEPGCGSGRIVEALARRGLRAVGIDVSPRMIELAQRRLGGVEGAEVFLADMTGFRLGRLFDGAVCPINTLLHLSPAEVASHLAAMAAHLQSGARYLAQVALYGPREIAEERASRWEIIHGDTALEITWTTEDVDIASRRLRQRSHVAILSGPRAGEVLQEIHEMTAWTPDAWNAAIADSAFDCTATYNGGRDDRSAVPPDSTGTMLWHELTRR